MNNAIRLTNKTAIQLRKNAVKLRTAHYAAACIIGVLSAVAAVLWGLKWLPGVPVTVAAAVLLDSMIVMRGRSVYLSLIGQAICTEAAAREIRAGVSESRRREKAITDLISVKADAQRARQEKAASDRDSESGQERNTENHESASRRRRREDGLKLIRSEQVK